jgi:hypothetical protein
MKAQIHLIKSNCFCKDFLSVQFFPIIYAGLDFSKMKLDYAKFHFHSSATWKDEEDLQKSISDARLTSILYFDGSDPAF